MPVSFGKDVAATAGEIQECIRAGTQQFTNTEKGQLVTVLIAGDMEACKGHITEENVNVSLQNKFNIFPLHMAAEKGQVIRNDNAFYYAPIRAVLT